jgi:LmbE family N-acetylglucosaminyl deacetylase
MGTVGEVRAGVASSVVSALTERLGLPADRGPRILVASAHPDDAEIGAGGTIARLVAERPDATVTWVVMAAPDPGRAAEAGRSAERLLAGVAGSVIDIRGLRDGYLPFLGEAAKDALADHGAADPDLVLAPRRDDAHQDHRLVAELAAQLFRRGTILEYEVPKWDGDLGTANLYVPLSATQVDAKVAHLVASYPSQAGRDWFSEDTFRAILRLRGIECRAPDGTAEAFVCRKLVV